MNLSTLTDRELHLLLGHSLYLTHALRAAARAEQKARLCVFGHRPGALPPFPSVLLGGWESKPPAIWDPENRVTVQHLCVLFHTRGRRHGFAGRKPTPAGFRPVTLASGRANGCAGEGRGA